MRRGDWWPKLIGLAEDQGGLVTAAQARLAGATRSQLLDLVDRGVLDRVQHGVYQLSGSPVDRWTRTRAAWLAISPERTAADRLAGDDPDGVLSHRSAALLLNLGDIDADQIEFTTGGRRRTRNPAVTIHRASLERSDWTFREGMPVTTPIKTVQTLAAEGLDLGHLADVARDALLRHDIPADDLAAALERSAKKYGYPDGGSLLSTLLKSAGMPSSTVDLVAMAAADAAVDRLAGSERIHQPAGRISQRKQDLISPAVLAAARQGAANR